MDYLLYNPFCKWIIYYTIHTVNGLYNKLSFSLKYYLTNNPRIESL